MVGRRLAAHSWGKTLHCRHRPWFDEVQIFGPKVDQGRVQLDDRPGLGIELDWEYVRKHPYRRLAQPTFADRDGGMPLI